MHYRLSKTKCLFLSYNKTVIDFDAVDIRIYQPEKVIFTEAGGLGEYHFLRLINPYIHRIEVNNCIMSTEIEVNNCFVI